MRYHPSHVWRLLKRLGWSCQRPTGRALERDEATIRHWKRVRWPTLKQTLPPKGNDRLRRRERTERAAASLPDLGATGADASPTYHFNWNLLSAIAGITWWNFYFRLFPGPIKGPQVVEFLAHLQQQLCRKLLVIWDGLPAHRSRVVRECVAAQRGRITLEYLPGYAPELHPVEYAWGYWKHHELPNLCPKTFGEISHHARAALRRMRRRPTLDAAFWQQAKLF